MKIFAKKVSKYDFLILFIKGILFYLIFGNFPRTKESNRLDENFGNLNQNYTIYHHYVNKLDNKLILDLSKQGVLNLVELDSDISLSLDLEGKIIGYKPLITKMPSYWNSEVTKQMLIKNNSFSLSYKKDQVISLRFISLS